MNDRFVNLSVVEKNNAEVVAYLCHQTFSKKSDAVFQYPGL